MLSTSIGGGKSALDEHRHRTGYQGTTRSARMTSVSDDPLGPSGATFRQPAEGGLEPERPSRAGAIGVHGGQAPWAEAAGRASSASGASVSRKKRSSSDSCPARLRSASRLRSAMVPLRRSFRRLGHQEDRRAEVLDQREQVRGDHHRCARPAARRRIESCIVRIPLRVEPGQGFVEHDDARGSWR